MTWQGAALARRLPESRPPRGPGSAEASSALWLAAGAGGPRRENPLAPKQGEVGVAGHRAGRRDGVGLAARLVLGEQDQGEHRTAPAGCPSAASRPTLSLGPGVSAFPTVPSAMF